MERSFPDLAVDPAANQNNRNNPQQIVGLFIYSFSHHWNLTGAAPKGLPPPLTHHYFGGERQK